MFQFRKMDLEDPYDRRIFEEFECEHKVSVYLFEWDDDLTGLGFQVAVIEKDPKGWEGVAGARWVLRTFFNQVHGNPFHCPSRKGVYHDFYETMVEAKEHLLTRVAEAAYEIFVTRPQAESRQGEK